VTPGRHPFRAPPKRTGTLRARSFAACLLAAAPFVTAGGQDLRTYAVGSIPVAPGLFSLEFPVQARIRGEIGAVLLGQGTYDSHTPFEYLSVVSAVAWVHFDGAPNLRLSLGFAELFRREVAPIGLRDGHEEQFAARARFQQPRATAAVYEVVQLEVRSFDDAGGTHRVVYRPRFRVGQGVNLDAARTHSLAFFQEIALRFADASYTKRAFDFFRTFVGYTWTTRRGTYVTLGAIGQISLNPAATRYDFWYGPALAATYRFRPTERAKAAPSPPELEVP
jgi:hypothetical protein